MLDLAGVSILDAPYLFNLTTVRMQRFWWYFSLRWPMFKALTTNNNNMKEKEQYISPESEALEMKLEGVIASSDSGLPEEEW